MGTVALESEVRLRTQANDTTAVPTALVDVAMEDANTILVQHLVADAYDAPVDDAVVLGETLLSCALLLRSLASAAAVSGESVRVGGQSLERGKRFAELQRMAAGFEAEAWEVLGAHAVALPGESASVTESHPVMGE